MARSDEITWTARAREEIEGEPGGPGWAESVLAFVRRHAGAPKGASPYDPPVGVFVAGGGNPRERAEAVAWLLRSAFGLRAVRTELVPAGGRSVRHVVQVGDGGMRLDLEAALAAAAPAPVRAVSGAPEAAPARPAADAPVSAAPTSDARQPVAEPSGRPRIALVADVPGWAFDRNLRDMAAALSDFADFTFHYASGQLAEDWSGHDLVYVAWHMLLASSGSRDRVPWGRVVTSVRSQWLDTGEPGTWPAEILAALGKATAVHAATGTMAEELRRRGVPAAWLTNPVDCGAFRPGEEPWARPLRAVLAANLAEWRPKALQDLKGHASVIRPACEAVGMELLTSGYDARTGPERTKAEMPDFYRQGHVYLCASSMEGASNSVMEAMACGLLLVATDVGNHGELLESVRERSPGRATPGVTVVERTADAFSEALRALQRARPDTLRRRGLLNARTMAEAWSWDVWAPRYRAWFEAALRRRTPA